MKTKIIIATHGRFAIGIQDSLRMISGMHNDIETICAYSEENIDYRKLIENKIKEHNYQEANLLVMTDLVGGSVNNEFMRYIKAYPFYLISGLNLGLLLELVIQKDDLNEDIIRSCCSDSKKFIMFCNDCLDNKEAESDF